MAECPVWRTCEFCRVAQRIDFGTDGQGHLVELPLACGCEAKVRPVLGGRRCLDCPSTVQGRSHRCAACRMRRIAEKHKGYVETWREKHPETYAKLQAAQNARRREERAGPSGDDVRAKDRAKDKTQKNLRRREAIRNPTVRAHRNAQKRTWAKAHPESVKRSQDKQNAMRASDKRQYMHDYATKHVGKYATAPKCRKCGATIAYDGLGRPRLDCETCRNVLTEARPLS